MFFPIKHTTTMLKTITIGSNDCNRLDDTVLFYAGCKVNVVETGTAEGSYSGQQKKIKNIKKMLHYI